MLSETGLPPPPSSSLASGARSSSSRDSAASRPSSGAASVADAAAASALRLSSASPAAAAASALRRSSASLKRFPLTPPPPVDFLMPALIERKFAGLLSSCAATGSTFVLISLRRLHRFLVVPLSSAPFVTGSLNRLFFRNGLKFAGLRSSTAATGFTLVLSSSSRHFRPTVVAPGGARRTPCPRPSSDPTDRLELPQSRPKRLSSSSDVPRRPARAFIRAVSAPGMVLPLVDRSLSACDLHYFCDDSLP